MNASGYEIFSGSNIVRKEMTDAEHMAVELLVGITDCGYSDLKEVFRLIKIHDHLDRVVEIYESEKEAGTDSLFHAVMQATKEVAIDRIARSDKQRERLESIVLDENYIAWEIADYGEATGEEAEMLENYMGYGKK
jgi:hypothetical protein